MTIIHKPVGYPRRFQVRTSGEPVARVLETAIPVRAELKNLGETKIPHLGIERLVLHTMGPRMGELVPVLMPWQSLLQQRKQRCPDWEELMPGRTLRVGPRDANGLEGRSVGALRSEISPTAGLWHGLSSATRLRRSPLDVFSRPVCPSKSCPQAAGEGAVPVSGG